MKKLLPVILILIILTFSYSHIFSQCAMCTATAESSRDAGSSVAESINKGVLYIFMMPYLIIATVGYFWWRAKKKAEADMQV